MSTNNATVTLRGVGNNVITVNIDANNPQTYRRIVEFAMPSVDTATTTLTVIAEGEQATSNPAWDTPATPGDVLILTKKVGNGQA